MNPLTQVKNTQKITQREQAIGITDEGSWHAKYKDSAYVYVGGLPFDLTEGDVLAVFAQYGEIVDVNLVRDKTTGKSKGFAFLAYEDQRSTVLAVDNLNGARVVGRIIKVDHVGDYKRKLEEDEEEKQKKREERGVCYAFQRGECNRGDDCKYSHDEERNANTGWGGGGGGGGGGGWKHDQFDGSMQEASRRMNMSSSTRRDDNGIRERDDKPRGVCYAFQRGECNRGDGCRFAHDEQRNTNPTRGGQFDGSMREAARRMNPVSTKSKESDPSDLDEPPQRRRDTDRNRDNDVSRRREISYERVDGRGRREDGRRRDRNDHDDEERRDVRRGRDEDDDVRRERREGSYDRDDGRGRRDDGRRRGRDEEDDVRKERERSDRGGAGRRMGGDDSDEEEKTDVRRGRGEDDEVRNERGGERSVRSRR